MKTIRLFITILPFLCLSAAGPKAQAVLPPPDGGYPNFTTAEGEKALFSLTSGAANTAVGWRSLFSNAEGSFNTATGAGALLFNTNDNNTAFGAAALLFNTGGDSNVAVGAGALVSNTAGRLNTAVGTQALSSNDTGHGNTAVGGEALFNNTIGQLNTATGQSALFSNTEGQQNTANGLSALFSNTTGSDNTATGAGALSDNITGVENTATGANALPNQTQGERNTANGFSALLLNTEGIRNTAIGAFALQNSTGDRNIGLGHAAGSGVTTANDVICIGTAGANVDNSCYIGQIFGATIPGGVAVIVDASGHLGTVVSSQRFKDEIKSMDKASEAILALKPVTFRYKKEIDPKSIPQFGLVAEDVAKVNPDLVARDAKGELYTVRYEAVNAMLLNEFLKEHRKVEKLEATVAALAERVNEQTAQLQRVTAQVEITGSAMRVAAESP